MEKNKISIVVGLGYKGEKLNGFYVIEMDIEKSEYKKNYLPIKKVIDLVLGEKIVGLRLKNGQLEGVECSLDKYPKYYIEDEKIEGAGVFIIGEYYIEKNRYFKIVNESLKVEDLLDGLLINLIESKKISLINARISVVREEVAKGIRVIKFKNRSYFDSYNVNRDNENLEVLKEQFIWHSNNYQYIDRAKEVLIKILKMKKLDTLSENQKNMYEFCININNVELLIDLINYFKCVKEPTYLMNLILIRGKLDKRIDLLCYLEENYVGYRESIRYDEINKRYELIKYLKKEDLELARLNKYVTTDALIRLILNRKLRDAELSKLEIDWIYNYLSKRKSLIELIFKDDEIKEAIKADLLVRMYNIEYMNNRLRIEELKNEVKSYFDNYRYMSRIDVNKVINDIVREGNPRDLKYFLVKNRLLIKSYKKRIRIEGEVSKEFKDEIEKLKMSRIIRIGEEVVII